MNAPLPPAPASDLDKAGRLDVLVLGSAQYSDRSWVNCQEVASRLAARGHRVLFVDSPGLRAPRAAGRDLRRMVRRLGDAARGLQAVAPGLHVLSPVVPSVFPFSPPILAWSVRRAVRHLGLRPDAVIAYLPTWAGVVERFSAARRVYHCVDAYAENPGVDRRRVGALETRLLRAVDLVLAVSPPLCDRLARLHPQVELWPNVADVARFATAAGGPLPPDLAALPPPRLIYLGNLAAYKVNLALLAALARARPLWTFALVGPVGRGDPETDVAPLAALPNVHLLGERDRALAPSYVAAADVCLLPLQEGASTAHSSPLKIYEYLAAAKPVVATPIPAVAELVRAGLVAGARTETEWLAAIEELLACGHEQAAARRAEAFRHGWEERIDEIERLLGG